MPACWKVAKLSPIHKKGEVLNPGNYRMIAVSGVIYRIFPNVLKDLVTDWCLKKGKIPDTQFGFFPGRVLLPGKKPNCVSGILPFFTHRSATKSFSTLAKIRYITPLTAIIWIQHFPFFTDGAQLGVLPARRHFTLRQQHSEKACHQRHQHIHQLEFTITPHRQARMLNEGDRDSIEP